MQEEKEGWNPQHFEEKMLGQSYVPLKSPDNNSQCGPEYLSNPASKSINKY